MGGGSFQVPKVPLKHFISTNPMLEKRQVFSSIHAQWETFAHEKSKAIINPLVQHLGDLHSRGLCLRELRPENILVTHDGAGAEFQDIIEMPATPDLMLDNMLSFADIVENNIFLNAELPVGMARLVWLMRRDNSAYWRPLIRNHLALVPQVERGVVFF
uniref:Gdh1 n=1 Tax=Arundo donax TaxID=35708 RepID=A0A0A9UDD2_ARUDO